MSKYLIIGADPGHTIGLCACDFEGKPILCQSIENGGIREAVSIIESWGTPSIIASDVRPASEFVQKLASYFNVRLFVPRNSFREDFKRLLLKKEEAKAGKKIAQNNHERDAFAAAIMAWRENQNLIRSALATKMEQKEKFAHLLLQGYRQDSAMLEINPPKKEERIAEEKPREGQRKRDGNIIALEQGRKSVQLQKRVEFLEQENELLLQKLKSAQNGVYGRMMREKQIRKLLVKISSLETRLKRAQQNSGGKNLQMHNKKENAWQSQTKKEKADKKSAEENRVLGSRNLHNQTEEVQKKENKESSNENSQQNLKGLNSFDTLARLVREYRRGRANKE
ncbi:MAG: DUF460 domain-containing protein [Candidatus Micrarchaeota archaeon]